jgi:hypothetical protein
VTTDSLLDPPGSIGRELESASPIESVDSLDEADIRLLDQILKAATGALVALRDRDSESKVRFDHLVSGPFVTSLDPL